ncbi:MAG: BBP7 family outer membrane beta-barrel protein [Planctomycetales bacterium]
MTRARGLALALVVGACSWIPATARAQYGPPNGYPAMMNGSPMAEGSMLPGDPQGMTAPPGGWYGDQQDYQSEQAPARYSSEPLFNGGFIRAEYLHWNLPDPGTTLLGAAVNNIANPTDPFVVYFPGTSLPQAVTRIPTAQSVKLADVNGIRTTVGLELFHGGTIEVGAFMLAKKQSGFEIDNFASTSVGSFPFFRNLPGTVGTSLLENGQVSDTVLLYNQSFSVTYASQVWGAEANYVIDNDNGGLFHLNPTVGLRYFNIHETMNQRGVFQDTTLGGPEIVTTIGSSAYNNLYGGQFGARLELVTKYFNLGLDPKLMLLGNSMFAQVDTNHLRSNNDPFTSSSDRVNRFSLGVDIGTYATLNLRPNFSVRVGYNLIWLNRVTRPEDNIYYNNNGLSNPPAVGTNLTDHDFMVHGVSVGGELRF